MPLRIISQPKIRVTARPETDGMRMAKIPARMRRTLRAMDQLIALGTRPERVAGAVLMCSSKCWIVGPGGWAEDSIMM